MTTTSTQTPQRSNRRGRWMFWLRAAAGLALVAFLAQRTDWRPVAAAIQAMRWQHWFAAAGIYLASQVVSAWRWAALARPLGFDLPQRQFTRLYFEGMFFSLCLPSSIGGDVVKAYRLAPTAAGRLLAGCTVLADRATGLIGLFVIGLTALTVRSFGLPLAGVLAAGAGILVAALASVSIGLAILNQFVRLLPRDGRLARLLGQLMPYHARPEVFRRAIGWGLIVQLFNVLVVVELGAAMGLEIPLVAYFIAVPVVALLTMLPVSVSGVGVREGGLAWMLASYGVSQGIGITLGILWFLVTVAGGLVGGLEYLFGEKQSAISSSDELDAERNADFAGQVAIPMPLSPTLLEKIADMTFSVVVPVFNERENLVRLYRATCAVMEALGRPFETLFIDDGSTDGSAEVLDELAANDERVKIVRFRRNFGQTAAMNAGIHLARGDVIVMLDADLQNDPADIPMMLDKLAEGY
ncbi:MAG TPA: lysylphosphatidylglycerol synthase domain-containing protein, partial [Pirellulales bacterium]|nr:lysylphosphatidylglycerol synthase domain-containing protein [Pirellulales bacterium]